MKQQQDKELTKFIFISALDNLMRKRNLSQLALSKSLGIRQSQVSNWLAGKSLPGFESIQLLCSYFKIGADQFFVCI